MPTYCGTSVDTRMAPGDADVGPHYTERHDRAPTGPNVYETVSLSVSHGASESQNILSADTFVSRRHPGIHRHPTVFTHSYTPQMPHGSQNPSATPRRGKPPPIATLCL